MRLNKKIRYDIISKMVMSPSKLCFSHTGVVVVGRSLERHGLIASPLNIKLLKSALLELGYEFGHMNSYEAFGVSQRGMSYGPKMSKMSFNDRKTPGVYEIICKPTGKRYVGSSKRPDLRRAVHYFWLKNVNEDGLSNIFQNNREIAEDIKKYGPDAFYMEIVKQVPDASRKDLEAEEAEYMAKVEDKLYNIYQTHKKQMKYSKKFYSSDWVDAYKSWTDAVIKYKQMKTEYSFITNPSAKKKFKKKLKLFLEHKRALRAKTDSLRMKRGA